MAEPETQNQALRDLFDLPEQIRKGDFVLKLAEGIENPGTTAETYVVTPALALTFDRALGLVGSALRDRRSQAAYLHGSFGSGKSHFMALLSLLLAGNEQAWGIAEVHALRERHPFVGTKRLLELHFHMVGHDSIESAVFRGYLTAIRERHPDAPLPGLFADERLFENAEQLLETLGDERFFAPMNGGGAADSGWGDLSETWDRPRLRAAVTSPDPTVREKLFSALVRSHFRGWEERSRSFVDFDGGLATLARHAASLGYDAVILFLDELILWLAGRASDPGWLHLEVQKMVKLVEAADLKRDIPLVSFIARQRNLAEMVGEDYAGVEDLRLRESLKHWEGRYDTLELEDKNLPAIVEKRVLRPRDAAARDALNEAFEKLRRSAAAGGTLNTLLAHDDQAAFRRLYPFSPALVEVLVALSSSLQRQRTAIKLLLEILVEHTGGMTLGEIVRVGDLYDVLAAGQDSADGVMRSRFESAKQIYTFQLLPLLRRQNGTDSPARCQRMRPEHPTRLGCSGCGERQCRSDNRMVKTLLLAALVPEVDAVKDLTASRLVQLNHGSLKVPIPGTEATMTGQRLRGWASEVSQLTVGNENDARVRLRLEGVDVTPILDGARGEDSHGARQRVLREVLFEALGLQKVLDTGKPHSVEWRGTTRKGTVLFGNVRTLSPEALRCGDDEDWRLVIDYPFDERQFGPNDDLEALERFKETGAGTYTLVWLPTFLSESMEKLLGDLVVLEHILDTNETARRYVAHLSVENQSRALNDLQNLRSMKKTRLFQVLEQAYGLATPRDGDLDTSRAVETHLHLLKPGARLAPRLPPGFAQAVDLYVEDLLATRWPRHPRLAAKLTRKRVGELVALFGELVDAEDKKRPADRGQLEEVRGTLGELGLARVTESAVHLVEDRVLQDLENRRARAAVDRPTVGQLRGWLDEGGKMGLMEETQDLILRCYARFTARTFVSYGKAYTPEAGHGIPEEVVLEKPELPPPAVWASALGMAGGTLGVTLAGKALHADNLKRFESQLATELAAVKTAAERLPPLLERWAELLGVAGSADRLRTARSARALCQALAGQPVLQQIAVLAAFVPEVSDKAVGKSLASAEKVAAVLGDGLIEGQLRSVVRRPDLDGGAALIQSAAALLRQDEVNQPLADAARRLAEQAQRLINREEPDPGIERISVSATGKAEALAAIRRIADAIEKGGDGIVVTGQIFIRGGK